LIGTAPYMSPEQARGQSIDKRTDIWAFGCVLFEMLTGHIAFAGESISDTLVAVLDREPGWNTVPATLPGGVHRLLHRCLEKDPTRRRRNAGDVRTEIDEALVDRTAESDAKGPAPRKPAWQWVALLAIAIAAATVGALRWINRSPHPPSEPVRQTARFSIPFPSEAPMIGADRITVQRV